MTEGRVVRVEEEGDHEGVRRLHDRAFGGRAEGELVDRLREEGDARLSLVAEEGVEIVGHIMFSRLVIRTTRGVREALALAPMAVLPEQQRRGIGSLLVREGLDLCRDNGEKIVVVLGHPDYYPRFGFSAEAATPLHWPHYQGPALMALELQPDALDGVTGELEYAAAFEGV